MNWIYLFLLACPIGMGLMMWMMRGNGQQQAETRPVRTDLAGLRQQLQSSERQQAAIIDQIQRLREGESEAARDPAPSSDVPRTTTRGPALNRQA